MTKNYHIQREPILDTNPTWGHSILWWQALPEFQKLEQEEKTTLLGSLAFPMLWAEAMQASFQNFESAWANGFLDPFESQTLDLEGLPLPKFEQH